MREDEGRLKRRDIDECPNKSEESAQLLLRSAN